MLKLTEHVSLTLNLSQDIKNLFPLLDSSYVEDYYLFFTVKVDNISLFQF